MQENTCWKCNGTGYYVKSNRPQKKLRCGLCANVADLAEVEQARREKRGSFHVCICGAGIGGAALGLALGRLGFKVTLLERDATFAERKQGYGLTIQQGFAAIRYLNLEIPQDTPSFSHYAFDHTGRILGFFGTAFSEYFEYGQDYSKKAKGKFNGQGRFNIHIPRQHLRHMLLSAIEKENLENVNVRWGFKVDSFEKVSEREIKISGVDEEPIIANLYVGAEGIFSMTRKHILNDGLDFLKCVVVLGIAPVKHPLTHQRVCETMDGETRVYSMPFTSKEGKGIETDPLLRGKDTIMWQLSFPCETMEEAEAICKSNEELKREALRRCGKWHPPIPELIQETSQNFLSGHPVFDRPELDPKMLKNKLKEMELDGLVCLIGDAAHPMSPFKGQGANQALVDAVNLAKAMQELDDLSNLAPTLNAFIDEMCQRSAKKVIGSRVAADLLHKPISIQETPEGQQLADELASAGISALTPENLNETITQRVGFGHRPHLLHQVKVNKSRILEQQT